MAEEIASASVEGVASPVIPEPVTAAPVTTAPAAEPELVLTDAERVISEAEAEIRKLAQELHDKIVALAGDLHFGQPIYPLSQAKEALERAISWVGTHFHSMKESNNG